MPTRSACRVLRGLIIIVLTAVAWPAVASDWSYGCRGVLPSGDTPVIIFNRSQLVMLPKAWVKGPLLDSVNNQLLSSSFRAVDNNSGLVQTMSFTREEHPEDRLTLTEKSSKTISDVHHSPTPGGAPRSDQTTTYRKIYRWISNSIYEGPYDIEMDCINYELSAPLRR